MGYLKNIMKMSYHFAKSAKIVNSLKIQRYKYLSSKLQADVQQPSYVLAVQSEGVGASKLGALNHRVDR